MFKKFSPEESVSSTSQVKNSVTRGIQSGIIEQFPDLEDAIETLMPKKSMTIAKCQDHLQVILSNGEPIFYNKRDGPYFPTLRLVHKHPTFMKRMQVDKGAVPFVMSGANIMAPGFTSPGGAIPFDLAVGDPVAIYAEGKEHAIAIGCLLMSTDDIKSKNKGIAVENIHYLLDGLWQTKNIQ